MLPANQLFTRVELTPSGYTGLICKMTGDGLTAGRYVIPYGSRRTVRLAIRAEMRLVRKQASALLQRPRSR